MRKKSLPPVIPVGIVAAVAIGGAFAFSASREKARGEDMGALTEDNFSAFYVDSATVSFSTGRLAGIWQEKSDAIIEGLYEQARQQGGRSEAQALIELIRDHNIVILPHNPYAPDRPYNKLAMLSIFRDEQGVVSGQMRLDMKADNDDNVEAALSLLYEYQHRLKAYAGNSLTGDQSDGVYSASRSDPPVISFKTHDEYEAAIREYEEAVVQSESLAQAEREAAEALAQAEREAAEARQRAQEEEARRLAESGQVTVTIERLPVAALPSIVIGGTVYDHEALDQATTTLALTFDIYRNFIIEAHQTGWNHSYRPDENSQWKSYYAALNNLSQNAHDYVDMAMTRLDTEEMRPVTAEFNRAANAMELYARLNLAQNILRDLKETGGSRYSNLGSLESEKQKIAGLLEKIGYKNIDIDSPVIERLITQDKNYMKEVNEISLWAAAMTARMATALRSNATTQIAPPPIPAAPGSWN